MRSWLLGLVLLLLTPFTAVAEGLPDMLQRVMPSVVEITRGNALGSGFFIDDNGTIVTNQHVVDQAGDLTVSTSDDVEHPATLLGVDEQADIAVLRINGYKSQPLEFADSDEARLGEAVVAIGSGLSLTRSVSTGVVSGLGRMPSLSGYEYIQHDAAVNHGNSGGPLLTMEGELLGVNTSILSNSGDFAGIAMAIPSDTVKRLVALIERDGKVRRGMLGIKFQRLSPTLARGLGLPSTKGLMITEVLEGTPAARAGLQEGDFITALDGSRIKEPRALPRLLSERGPGGRATLSFLRGGQTHEVTVELAEVPDQQTAAAAPRELGLLLTAVDGVVRVGNVAEGSLAAEAGLQEGDIIKEVNQTPVSTAEDAMHLLDQPSNGMVIILAEREGAVQLLSIPR